MRMFDSNSATNTNSSLVRRSITRVSCVARRYVLADPRCDYRYWLSRKRFRQFKGRHAGQRCFIVGNGPSLRQMDLTPLRGEVTFGTNRIYLLFPRIGFATSYYVSVNYHVIEQCRYEIEELAMPVFINWSTRKLLRFKNNMMLVKDDYDDSFDFSMEPDKRIWEGSTVTYVAMQLAYFMGFRQVVLIGVDHSFVDKGTPHELVTSTGPDSNHFDPGYFDAGFRWQLPDLEASERSYSLAKRVFEQDGREILDATLNGKLTIFKKVSYESLF